MKSADPRPGGAPQSTSWMDGLLRFCLERKLIVLLLTVMTLGWGLRVAPFDWDLGGFPRDPVPVDAIPDIGENQQIVFTEWTGRSPQDVEDQITYPLTVSLLGIPGVRTIRSYSFFGFSSIYVIFEEDVEFYWSRSRVLEKLASLPAGTLAEGVQPMLGPDATALGQVYWYTLEGRDPDGRPAGGWDPHELRSLQDWHVRYALLSAKGISEVASVGGFVREYQVDVDPDAMRAYGVTLDQVFRAVKMSNVDVGARTIEINSVEYIIRGLGFLEDLADVEKTVVAVRDDVPVYVEDVAEVQLGPALRRGALDKGGAEAVGGVVVVRYGDNPLAGIKSVKAKIAEIAPGLPIRAVIRTDLIARSAVEAFASERGFEAWVDGQPDHEAWVAWLRSTPRQDWPEWVTTSQVTVVPFYDRSGLINETLGTLNTALVDEILVTVVVVLVMLWHLGSALLISALLPLAVLMCFIAMSVFGVDANVVALSGIAIAIGTMVDMGIILSENVLRHLEEAEQEESRLEVILRASSEVGSAMMTAVATTVIGFLPVFTMTGAEGKLFRPLAFTKTFALIASLVVALTILPSAAHLVLTGARAAGGTRRLVPLGIGLAGLVLLFLGLGWSGAALVALGLWFGFSHRLPAIARTVSGRVACGAAAVFVSVVLTEHWLPLGPIAGLPKNLLFVAVVIGGLLLSVTVFLRLYPRLLAWCLAHKAAFLSVPLVTVLAGASVWLGFERVFGFVPRVAEELAIGDETVRESRPWKRLAETFPGLGKEFMPPLDEGSYLYMPSTMPHASIGEALDVLQLQDRAFAAIPEVASAVGKIGRAESPLDPAPIAMVETVIDYHPEYLTGADGHRLRFRWDPERGDFDRTSEGDLVPDEDGRPYRVWRDHIRSPEDIWQEIVAAGQVEGTSSAPRLQPIAARIVMLQSGMRAPLGVKVKGPDLESIERAGLAIEAALREVPSVEPSSVLADRIVGKPYLEIDLDREAMARYGVHVREVQDVIEVAIGGRRITTTVEGRERYPVRVRYQRELRDDLESLGRILVPAAGAAQIPLAQMADIRFTRGPQVVKSEDTFLTGYVIFDRKPEFAEVDVVEEARALLAQSVASGALVLPEGVSYSFAGSYENQVRAQRTLAVVLPLALLIIFLVLDLQFRSVSTTLMVFSGILVAWAGGFLLLWAYGRPGFLDLDVFGTNLRDLFQVGPTNLSVAVWVGFLALFGIASDDGVVMATYLKQSFERRRPEGVAEIRAAAIAAGVRRARPCLMTSATTILALIPVLTSTGRGSDVMVPMAIPTFGGMIVVTISMFVVPVLWCAREELRERLGRSG